MGIESEFASRRAELQFETGTVLHLHIKGPAGVGKTRFALELCRAARWRREVIYIRQTSDFRLAELIDSVVPEAAVQLVVVADEVQFEQLQALRDSVGRGSGRVRLITIGHCSSPDPKPDTFDTDQAAGTADYGRGNKRLASINATRTRRFCDGLR